VRSPRLKTTTPTRREIVPNPIAIELENEKPHRIIKIPDNSVNTKSGKKTRRGLKKAETERIKPNVRIESLKIFTFVLPFRPK
jgi:hypothetical protein